MHHLHKPHVRTACFGLWCVGWLAVSVLLLIPIKSAVPGSDLVAHVLLFGTMALGAVTFCHRPLPLGLCAVLTLSVGVGLEYAQGLVPYRTFDVTDMLADALGALIGYVVALLVLYLVIRPAAPQLAGASGQSF